MHSQAHFHLESSNVAQKWRLASVFEPAEGHHHGLSHEMLFSGGPEKGFNGHA